MSVLSTAPPGSTAGRTPVPSETDWQTPIKLVDRPGLPEQYHLFDPESALAIRAALAARRPLLVRGEPGVGKTQLAAAAAKILKRPLVSKVVDSRTESRDLMWEFDAIMRLADAQIASVHPAADCPSAVDGNLQSRLDVANYVRPGPLWWAFHWENAWERATRTKTPFPVCDPGTDPRNGCVVLVDEIDKADSDVPNGLLEALGSGRFTPLGQSEAVEVRGETPLVVITTNEERVLPNAFVRRCLVLELKLPSADAALMDHLIARAEVHFPERAAASRGLFRKAAELLAADRRVAREKNLAPLPGQAEYLDLLRAVFDLECNSGARPEEVLDSVAKYAVRKYEQSGS
jgi:MoxR-like ATPase